MASLFIHKCSAETMEFFFFFSFYKLKLMNVGQLLNWFGELGLKKRPGSVVTVVEGMNIGTLLLIKEN